MGVKQVVTDDAVRQTGRVIYSCKICKTETERHYKGPEIAEPAQSS